MGLVDTLPIKRKHPVLYMPFWLGSLRDASDYGNHGANRTLGWRNNRCIDGIMPNASGGRIDVVDSVSLRTTSFSLIAHCRTGFTDEATTGKQIVWYRGSSEYIWFIRSGKFRLQGTGGNSERAGTITGSTTIGVTLESGNTPEFYIDGAAIGAGNLALTPPGAVHPTRIFGSSGDPMLTPVSAVLKYNAALTADEMSDLHDYFTDRCTPRKPWPGGGLDYAGATFTGEPTYIDNIQTARITLGNQTSGQLSNTGLRINSGTWAVIADASGRYISCAGAGQLERHLVGASAMGTKNFVESGGATLTKNAANIQVDAGTGDTVSAIVLVAP